MAAGPLATLVSAGRPAPTLFTGTFLTGIWALRAGDFGVRTSPPEIREPRPAPSLDFPEAYTYGMVVTGPVAVVEQQEPARLTGCTAHSGAWWWTYVPDRAPGWTTPAAEGGMLYWGIGEGIVVALHALGGGELWRTKVGPPETACGPPACSISGELLYATVGRLLSCLDRATGEVVWTGGIPPTHYEPVIADGRVCVPTDTGLVVYAAADVIRG